jgi:hypothetical protein
MKKIYNKIKRLIRYIPVIWNSEEFDYRYSLELFKMKLEDIASFLESDKAWSARAKYDASRIRMVLRLMDKVYDEEYSIEWITEIEKIYGNNIFDFEMEKGYLKYKYEDLPNAEEIRNKKRELFYKSLEKHKKAHKLLWKVIEHNIQHWWD